MKILCISDLHQRHGRLSLTQCDVLLIAGDVCSSGALSEFEYFVSWLTSQSDKFNKAILVAGNHDWCLFNHRPLCLDLLKTNLGDKVIYLEDSDVTIDGIKFYGSPWQPRFNNWAFGAERGAKLKNIWSNIPDDVDVLITHGPPFGVGDLVHNNHVGCVDLLSRLRDLSRLFLHVFGHIHSGTGHYTSEAINDITFCNAAICNEKYEPENFAHEYIITNVGTHKFLVCNEVSLRTTNG